MARDSNHTFVTFKGLQNQVSQKFIDALTIIDFNPSSSLPETEEEKNRLLVNPNYETVLDENRLQY